MRTPRGRDDPLVTRFTMLRYVVTGSYVGIATVASFMHRCGPLALSTLTLSTLTLALILPV